MKRHKHKKPNYYDTEYPIAVKRKQFNENTPYYFFTITLFIIGVISGNAVSYELNRKNILSVINPIEDTVALLSVEKSFPLLLKCFFTHFVYIFMIWFLSLTIIGIILVMFIIFFNGFMYGVVISSYSYQLGLQGFLVGFFYTFPQNIIIVPLLIYISSHSIKLSLAIFKNFFQNSSRKYLKELINKYYNQLFFAIGVLVIYSFIMVLFGNSFIKILKSLI